MAFIFGLICGGLISYCVYKLHNDDNGDHHVNQSSNTAGGDIVGRDKVSK